jgi:hypothetical protein
VLGITSWEFDCTPIQYWSSTLGKSAVGFCLAVAILLSCVLVSVNFISESATQREDCCMKSSDRNLHLGCTLSLKSFLRQK